MCGKAKYFRLGMKNPYFFAIVIITLGAVIFGFTLVNEKKRLDWIDLSYYHNFILFSSNLGSDVLRFLTSDSRYYN